MFIAERLQDPLKANPLHADGIKQLTCIIYYFLTIWMELVFSGLPNWPEEENAITFPKFIPLNAEKQVAPYESICKVVVYIWPRHKISSTLKNYNHLRRIHSRQKKRHFLRF